MREEESVEVASTVNNTRDTVPCAKVSMVEPTLTMEVESAQKDVIVQVVLVIRPVVPEECVPVCNRMSADVVKREEERVAERVGQGRILVPQSDEFCEDCST